MGEDMTDWEWENRCGCADKDAEIERLRAENERYEALFINLASVAQDRRYSDEFVGQLTRSRIDALLAAATKEDDRG